MSNLLHKPLWILAVSLLPLVLPTSTSAQTIPEDIFGGTRLGRIVKVDSVTGGQTLVTQITGLGSVRAVAVDSGGQIFAGIGSKVIRVDPATGTQTVVSSGENLIAPTGIAAYTGSNFHSEYLNDLFMGDFNAGRLWHIDLTADGLGYLSRDIFHDEPTAILDVVDGPDGYLYFCTSSTVRRIRRVIAVPAPEITNCDTLHETVRLDWINNEMLLHPKR